MDTRLLRAFIVLAETQNYRAAALRLFITQPALSKQIRTLENDLGVTLFARGRHGAQLTHAGELMRGKARELVERSDALLAYAGNVAQGTTGNLALGFGISGIKIAPVMVARFRRVYPDIIVSLEDIPSSQQIAQLLSGQLQLAFMRLPVTPPLAGRRLVNESLALAVKQKSSLAGRLDKHRDYKILDSQPLIKLLPEKGPGLYRQVAQFLAANNVVPNVVQQSRDLQTIMALVAAGVGVAIVPDSAVHIAPAGIELIALHGPYARWDMGMVWNPRLADPLRDRFIAMVDEADFSL